MALFSCAEMGMLMADNLFPENILTAALEDTKTVTGYRPGLRFNHETGDFVQDGKHRIQEADGTQSWADWCRFCLMTERYQHLAYTTDFGIETTEAFAAESREKAEALLTRQITEALKADPYGRTAYVEDVKYEWSAPDAVEVTVTVRGIDYVSIDVTASLTRR